MRFQLDSLCVIENSDDYLKDKPLWLETDGFMLSDEHGPIELAAEVPLPGYRPPSEKHKLPGKIQSINLQLGLKCNFSCAYCLQAENRNLDQSSAQLKKVATIAEYILQVSRDAPRLRVAFWGGEPLLYWPVIVAVVGALEARRSGLEFRLITNGALLTKEKADWLAEHGFHIGISHDGPQQAIRGPDPLDGPSGEAIKHLYNLLAPEYRISINPMIHGDQERTKVRQWFREKLQIQSIALGEGGRIDVHYPAAAKFAHQPDPAQTRLATWLDWSRDLHDPLRTPWYLDVVIVRAISALTRKTKLKEVHARCSQDDARSISVDMDGNLLTCHNFPAATHSYGKIVNIRSASQQGMLQPPSDRVRCLACPVVHLCKASCPVMDQGSFDLSCRVQLSEQLVILAILIEQLTGRRIYRITGAAGVIDLYPNKLLY